MLLAAWSSPCIVGSEGTLQNNQVDKESRGHQGRPLNSPMRKVKPEGEATQNGKETRMGKGRGHQPRGAFAFQEKELQTDIEKDFPPDSSPSSLSNTSLQKPRAQSVPRLASAFVLRRPEPERSLAMDSALSNPHNGSAEASSPANGTTRPPSTPEGIALAYGSLLLMALLPIFFGALRSVRCARGKSSSDMPETITSRDAARFPIIASCTLLGLYLFFKIFSQEYINLLLSMYFFVLGILALSHTI
ncbi:hypothetical protein STEG23_037170, partial [Scotinomys teguina]